MFLKKLLRYSYFVWVKVVHERETIYGMTKFFWKIVNQTHKV